MCNDRSHIYFSIVSIILGLESSNFLKLFFGILEVLTSNFLH